jgi:hypothetical protein
MVNDYVLLLHIVVAIIMNVWMAIWKNKCVRYINFTQLKRKVVKTFKLSAVVHERNVSIHVRYEMNLSMNNVQYALMCTLGDYDNSPLCEFKPVCRDKPNGNYVDQYRPNCQFHYTCLESRTFNYTACEHGHRFSVQNQKCLPAKQVRCFATRNMFVPIYFVMLLLSVS